MEQEIAVGSQAAASAQGSASSAAVHHHPTPSGPTGPRKFSHCCSVITLLLGLRQAGHGDFARRFIGWAREFQAKQGDAQHLLDEARSGLMKDQRIKDAYVALWGRSSFGFFQQNRLKSRPWGRSVVDGWMRQLVYYLKMVSVLIP